MKSNLPAIILIVVCLGLGIVLWWQHQSHAEQTVNLYQTINQISNKYTALEDRLAQQAAVNATLETSLAAARLDAAKELASAQSNLFTAYDSLKTAQADAKTAAAAVALAAADIADKDKKIAALESQNADLDKQSTALRSSITNLEAQILATQKKLETAEGDKKMLMAELAQLQGQKEDMERRLSDLVALKEQVRTVEANLSTARRLVWMQSDLYSPIGSKGAERLMSPPPPRPPPATNSLNVDFHQGGGARISSGGFTNAPSSNAPPSGAPSRR